jgi:hypothetical protein
MTTERLTLGATVENGLLRVHRYADSFFFWDLTNAGKRGRRVAVLTARPTYLGWSSREVVMEAVSGLVENLDSMAAAVALLEQYRDAQPGALELLNSTTRGIDVQPAGFQPIVIRSQRMAFEVSHGSFVLTDLTDKFNEPTCIPGKSKRLIPKLYQWASANQSRIEGMSYREILNELRALGVDYHAYCAVD